MEQLRRGLRFHLVIVAWEEEEEEEGEHQTCEGFPTGQNNLFSIFVCSRSDITSVLRATIPVA